MTEHDSGLVIDAASDDDVDPDVADGTLRELDPGFVPAERIASWIFVAVVFVLAVGGLSLSAINEWIPAFWLPWAIGAAVAVVLLLCWTAAFWPRIEYRHTRYLVSELGLEIRKGVVWRSRVNVPRSRIQHTDVSQGPIQRRYGIATLVVHTAGTESSQVEVSGLPLDTAHAIRDFLIDWGDGDGV